MNTPILRPGDVISLSIHPSIELSKYTFLKPSATITRKVEATDDPAIIIAEIEADLRKSVARAALVELGVLSDFTDALTNGGVEGLVEYLNKELSNEPARCTVEARSQARAEAGQARTEGDQARIPKAVRAPKPKPSGKH